MKIISAGKTWSDRIGCPDCKTKLEIDDNDVRFRRKRHSSIWGTDDDWFTDLFYVVCPSCKLHLELEELPAWVQNKARA